MIDAHVHLWEIGRHGFTWPDASLPAIHRDVRLDEAKAVARSHGVTSAMLVQAQEDAAETAWLLDQAADPFVAGVVGWADLARPEAIPVHPALTGLRPMVQDRADDWYDAPALADGFAAMAEAGLVLDALVRPRHLASVARLARQWPGLRIVIDHGAKPPLADGDLTAWGEAIGAAATCPNVACKLSGLVTETAPGRRQKGIAAAIDRLWHAFGAGRLIWGSDWPVLSLAGDYPGWLATARRLVPAAHHDAVFGRNARATYGLAA